MQNILTTVENLLPGDTSKSGDSTFVVVDVKPSKEMHYTDVTYVVITPGEAPRKWTDSMLSHTRYVTNR